MNITRRIAIRNLFIVSAAAAFLPSCLQDDKKVPVALKHLEVTSSQERALASLAEAIIPTTDTPGAKEISAHLFVLKMVDDCYTRKEQNAFMEGFEDFQNQSDKKFGKPFDQITPQQQVELLTALEADKADAPINSFYKSAKGLTVFGYTTSQFYLTKVKGYNIIPGKYQGAVRVKKPSPSNS